MFTRALHDSAQNHSVPDRTAVSAAGEGTSESPPVSEYEFRRMVGTDALARASEFLTEETTVVADVVARLAVPDEISMIVVGGAGSTHLAVPAKAVNRCVVVDPLGLSSWQQPTGCVSTVHLCSLHEISRSDLPASPLLWVFTFNVFPYLNEPIEVLRRLASPRDTVVVTTWAATGRAEEIRSGYLRYVFGAGGPRVEAVADVGRIARDLAVDHAGTRIEYVHGDVVSAVIAHLAAA